MNSSNDLLRLWIEYYNFRSNENAAWNKRNRHHPEMQIIAHKHKMNFIDFMEWLSERNRLMNQ